MIKSISFFFAVFLTAIQVNLFGQEEQLLPVQSNATLMEQTTKLGLANSSTMRVIDGLNIIITDTLPLPFIDEFSSYTLKPYKFTYSSPDSSALVAGQCVENSGVPTSLVPFNFDTTYFYKYNLVSKSIDSIPKNPILVRFYDSLTHCFDTARLYYLYPQAFRIVATDPLTGKTIDSTPILHDTLLRCASVNYFHFDTFSKWVDNFAYVNNTFPIDPPTIGVATLDGLNEFGLPYNKSAITAYGIADYLTSKPIKLKGYNYNDSVFISFFYEAKGLGDGPNETDSLILELLDDKGNWNKLWHRTGYVTEGIIPDTFAQIILRIPNKVSSIDPQYFYNGFQFRFKNYASLTGNNDHWHIDYVRLDKNRGLLDTSMDDVAFVYPVPFLLKDYTQKPADHFDPTKDLIDTIEIQNRDNDKTTFANKYSVSVNVSNSAVPLFSVSDKPYGTSRLKLLGENPKKFNIPTLTSDSIVIRTRFWMGAIDDLCDKNDTTEGFQVFHNLLAYDDGSAEKAYGIQGNGLKKFAYQFDLAKKDTLAGLMIHYTNIDENVQDLVFNITIWSSIEVGTANEKVIAELVNVKPKYFEPYNKFAVYVLDTPLILTGKVYIGWLQTDLRNLQIGYDRNSARGRSKMFVFNNGTWKASTVPLDGSPMIRAIIDGNYKLASSIKPLDIEDYQIRVYPNPVQDILHISSATGETKTVELIDVLGTSHINTTMNNQAEIDCQNLQRGLYILNVKKEGKIVYTGKILK
ncbi:MAG: T9SS type A sorting domain-containing protein [Chitinophagales bacterium]|nr:T9SS type A sorting domain-containing protein [Chitinophagales bacterium]